MNSIFSTYLLFDFLAQKSFLAGHFSSQNLKAQTKNKINHTHTQTHTHTHWRRKTASRIDFQNLSNRNFDAAAAVDVALLASTIQVGRQSCKLVSGASSDRSATLDGVKHHKLAEENFHKN